MVVVCKSVALQEDHQTYQCTTILRINSALLARARGQRIAVVWLCVCVCVCVCVYHHMILEVRHFAIQERDQKIGTTMKGQNYNYYLLYFIC